MTNEERKNLTKKRANRAEVDAFYQLAAALSSMLQAEEAMQSRAKLIPGGWRDLRMIRSRMENLVLDMLATFEPDKQRTIGRQMQNLRVKTVFGPQAAKDPDEILLRTEDLGVMICAATEACKLHMCPAAECARCRLGKVLDEVSFVSRDGRAWWEVFGQARRWDVGMDEDD